MEFLIKLFLGFLILFGLTFFVTVLDNFVPPKVPTLTNAQLAEKVTKSFACHISFYDKALQVKIKSISIDSRTIDYKHSSNIPNMIEYVGVSPIRNFSGTFTIDSIGNITPEPKNSIVLFDGKERLIGDERKLVFLKAQSTAGITRLDVIPNCLL
ncbi:MAG TPA: hypothetical protein PKC44_03730 [Agitococcus sp.]|nr:hypothetical protein [Agitococcus sp.]